MFCFVVSPPLAKTPSGLFEVPSIFGSKPKIFAVILANSKKLVNLPVDKFNAEPSSILSIVLITPYTIECYRVGDSPIFVFRNGENILYSNHDEEFIEDMASAYQWADVVITRAGAMTIAEVLAFAKPSILIPNPRCAKNHQLYNAMSIADQGAASCTLEDIKRVANTYLTQNSSKSVIAGKGFEDEISKLGFSINII